MREWVNPRRLHEEAQGFVVREVTGGVDPNVQVAIGEQAAKVLEAFRVSARCQLLGRAAGDPGILRLELRHQLSVAGRRGTGPEGQQERPP